MKTASEVASLLIEIGQRLELAGDSPFKARAYYKAAESLRTLPASLEAIVSSGKLRDVPGVGEAIAEKIIKLQQTGTHPTLEHLREQVPAGVLEILRVPGLGPKKAALLYETLKIGSLDELEAACQTGRLRSCKGFSERREAKILEAIAFLRGGAGKCLLSKAEAILLATRTALEASQPDWDKILPAGSVRRACELPDDLRLVAQTAKPSAWEKTPWKINKFQEAEVWAVPAEYYGLALLFATGSQSHLSQLAAHAAGRGLRLNEKGLWREGKALLCRTEEEIYAAMGLPFITPELREGRGEIELAMRSALPKYIQTADLRGVLHCHTTFSDGLQSLSDMARAAQAAGYQYLGVADHSQTAAYAGGMREEKVLEQFQAAARLNKAAKQNFRIFKGIESDIGLDGSLDYPEPLLNEFDFIIASIHSRFELDKEAQTRRVLNAVSRPQTTILGHPTGRLLLQREGYALDLEAVLQACARHGVVVELNANPQRLDLDWRWHKRALELGCLLSINPDAHAAGEMAYMEYGLKIARKGGVPPERVLNCMSLQEIAQYFAQRKKLVASG